MLRSVLYFAIFVCLCRSSVAQTATLQLHPELASARATAVRLLPKDTELKEGNAAVVILRMIWEQQQFMQNVVPKIPEFLELPFDDPRLAKEFPFDRRQEELLRAAYMRHADWNYPLHEESLATILLPDVQGMRTFAGHGLSLWTRVRIAQRDFPEAHEGILTQLASARHIARTPILVNRLVAENIARQALQSIELLIQQPDSPNLYWALALLPDELGDSTAFLQWESEMLPRSLPSLRNGEPDTEDPRWKKIAEEFSTFMMEMSGVKPMSIQEGLALKSKMLAEASEYLVREQLCSEQQMKNWSEEAIVMRWILDLNTVIHGRIEAAYQLAPPQALEELADVMKLIDDETKRIDAPASPFPASCRNIYLTTHLFDRHVKFLQTIEALRDYTASHKNQLPKSLDELELHAPIDPLTGKPFLYELNGDKATLRTPEIPDLTKEQQQSIPKSYTLTIKKD